MQPERLAMVVLTLALVGCATAPRESMPQESPQEKRESAASVHTELGQQYMQRGELETALNKLNKALQFDPDYVPAHTVLGVLYERIGKYDKAEQHYRRAVELEPNKGATNNNFGAFLCKEGKIDEALGYFKHALADPFYKTPAAAYTNAGTCLLKANRNVEAEKQFRSALALNPRSAEALYQLAQALYKKQDYFHARAFIQRFDALDQPSPDALVLGYQIESRLGNSEAAQAYMRRLRTRFPDSEQARALATTTTKQ